MEPPSTPRPSGPKQRTALIFAGIGVFFLLGALSLFFLSKMPVTGWTPFTFGMLFLAFSAWEWRRHR
jgi:hypothetical protein